MGRVPEKTRSQSYRCSKCEDIEKRKTGLPVNARNDIILVFNDILLVIGMI